jgi:NADH-quinone oxidoreductase subunit H
LSSLVTFFNETALFGWPLSNIVYLLVLCLVVIVGGMSGMALGTWFERRFIALIQVRKGPNRVGPLGLFQPVADGIKTFFKEDIIPDGVDKPLNKLAPALALFAALMSLAVLPFGPDVEIPGWGTLTLYISNLNVGVLYLLGVGSLHVYGVVLAGWSSNNKYSLLGALRGAAQLVSYEIVLGMSLVGVVMITGEMSLKGIVEWQMNHRIPLVLLQPVAFGLYFIAMFAETNRPPFDLVEADTELTGGFHTEYSGFRYALFMIAEYVAMITVSVVATACFFGGWGGPFGFLPGIWWTFVGILFFFFMFVWVRATIPRLRYDQLMRFSWSYLIPIGLVNLAVTAVAVVLIDAN